MEADSLRVGFCVDGPRIDSTSSEILFFFESWKRSRFEFLENTIIPTQFQTHQIIYLPT
jgi:hypothetical protein